jgi:hypothetical protein
MSIECSVEITSIISATAEIGGGSGGAVTIQNTNITYEGTANCGSTFTLPDTDYEIYLDGTLSASGTYTTLDDNTFDITIN